MNAFKTFGFRFWIVKILICFILFYGVNGFAQRLPVRLAEVTGKSRIDVYIGEEWFTSYRFPSDLEKPVLFPVLAPGGISVTRGFPLEPRPGERTDHPHHVGMWFNFGDVNGLDFWNNSYAVPQADKPKFGSVRHRQVLAPSAGNQGDFLKVRSHWVDFNGRVLLEEETEFRFSGQGSVRGVERSTTLTAAVPKVVFTDNKEGLLAIRVDRAFEEPLTEPEVLVGPDGKPMNRPTLDNADVNGKYRNSEGEEGVAAWGRRAKWVKLSAVKDGVPLTIAMVDHPRNPGHPAHWHARGYGLFSVNNLGSRVFVPADPQIITTLAKGESIRFRHLFLVGRTQDLTDSEMNRIFSEFSR